MSTGIVPTVPIAISAGQTAYRHRTQRPSPNSPRHATCSLLPLNIVLIPSLEISVSNVRLDLLGHGWLDGRYVDPIELDDLPLLLDHVLWVVAPSVIIRPLALYRLQPIRDHLVLGVSQGPPPKGLVGQVDLVHSLSNRQVFQRNVLNIAIEIRRAHIRMMISAHVHLKCQMLILIHKIHKVRRLQRRPNAFRGATDVAEVQSDVF